MYHVLNSNQVNPWYLYKMIAQNMLRTCEVKGEKCLEGIELLTLHFTSGSHAVPSNLTLIVLGGGVKIPQLSQSLITQKMHLDDTLKYLCKF